MTNKLTPKVMVKEATYWDKVKKALKENPGKVCHK